MLNRILHRLGLVRRDHQMSDRWLREQAFETTRVRFDGPRISLPIRKIENERGWVNRLQLRRSA